MESVYQYPDNNFQEKINTRGCVLKLAKMQQKRNIELEHKTQHMREITNKKKSYNRKTVVLKPKIHNYFQ